MRDFASSVGVVSACGFGLSKAATSIGYLSAMGSVTRNIGFVTELWFMLASEAVSLVLAVVVAALAAHGRIRPRSIPQWQALLVFFAGFLLSISGVLSGLPEAASAGVLGLFYGVSSFLFCVTWLEEFAYQKPRESHRRMVAGLCIQMVVVAATSVVPPSLLPLCAMFSALLSCLCHVDVVLRASGALTFGLRRAALLDRPSAPSAAETFEPVTARAFVAQYGAAFACLFVLVGVVGILHTSVLGSSFEHIVGGVSMWVPLAAATLVTAVAALVALRLPDPTSVYKAVLPVMLVLLSLLPFVGDFLGPFAGAVMIACYDVCGMLFLFFIVDAAHCHRQQSYLLSSVYMGGSNGFLALGLGIGLVLNYVSGDYGISLMTLFAFVAIYPLCIAFAALMRRSLRGMGRLAREGGNAGAQAPGKPAVQSAAGAGLSPAAGSRSSGGKGPHASGVAGAGSAGTFRAGDPCDFPAHRRPPSSASGDVGAFANASLGEQDVAHAQRMQESGGGAPEQGSAPAPATDSASVSATPAIDWEAALRAFAEKYRLTKRETEICSYLVRGRSAKHIAEELFISENTVWTHTKNVYAKTKVSGKDGLMNLFEYEALER